MHTDPPPGRWGEESAGAAGLDPRTRAFASAHLGAPTPFPGPEVFPVADRRLDDATLERLFHGLRWDCSDNARASHSRGMSYLDLLAWRSGSDVQWAPDAVLYPRDHEEALRILQTCSAERIAVVPMGGGTSVTGGLTAAGEPRPTVVVSLSEMAALLEVDHESGIATVEGGITGPQLEAALGSWTLGHFPQSWERASIGGYIAARSSGQSSGGYGRIEDMMVGATLATPVGTWQVGGFPAASMGPDLRHLVLGSEGTLGIVTTAQLRLRPRPTIRAYAAALVPGDIEAGSHVMQRLTRSALRPTILRVSDPAETDAMLAMSAPRGWKGSAFNTYLRVRKALPGNLVILGWEGTRRDTVQAQRLFARDVLSECGAVNLGGSPGRSWERGRFHGPFLRDQLMDAGYLVETFETVTTWAHLPRVHAKVSAVAREALGERSYVMAHLSHSYDTGASIYFTVLAGGESDPDHAARRWQEVKRRVTDAIVSEGAAVSHHHGIGRDHRPWLSDQVGALGVDVLRAVKASLDPMQIMNPGAVIADQP